MRPYTGHALSLLSFVAAIGAEGELMMRMRNAAATMHQRDVLLATAFDGIGGLPMATIDRFRELKQKEVEELLAVRGIKVESQGGGGPAVGRF